MEHRQLLEDLGVTGTPTFKIFIDGEEHSTLVGPHLDDLTANIDSAVEEYLAN